MPAHPFFASRRSPGFAVAKCLSSVSSSPNTVGWNDAVSCSEIGDGGASEAEVTALSEVDDDDDAIAGSIPVRAYFYSTRFDFPFF